MGKKKIEIEKIENQDKRMVAFSKRRQGLFKKAADVCRLCDAQAAVIVFSPAGKLYSFGHTSVDDVIHRYRNGLENENKNKYRTDLYHPMLRSSGGGFWWDNINIDELDSVEKIQVVYNAMLKLKQNVSKRSETLTSSSASAWDRFISTSTADISHQ